MSIKAEVLEMSKAIEALVTVNRETGVIAEQKSGEVFEKTLPADLTMETVQRVHDQESLFIAGATHYYTNAAIDIMASNKGISEVQGELKIGKNTLNLQTDRTKEYTNHLNGSGEKTVKYGVTTIGYDVKGSKKSGGQIKAILNEASERALSALK